METTKMIFYRNLLFRTFLVGILFTILLFIATVALRSIYMPQVTSIFGLEEKEVDETILGFFLDARLVLVYFMLAPAAALHWMAKGLKG